jgi:hypothetical protein
MKILYIGDSSTNLRQSLLESLSGPCIGKARRFSYLVKEKAEQVKDQLLKEYRETHSATGGASSNGPSGCSGALSQYAMAFLQQLVLVLNHFHNRDTYYCQMQASKS